MSSGFPSIAALALAAALGACRNHTVEGRATSDRPTEGRVAAQAAQPSHEQTTKKPVPLYSPFVVEVQSDAPFTKVSFKQVGSFRGTGDKTAMFEAMAESLAWELSQRGAASNAAFTPEITDPTQHLACGSSHIYVDFWENEDAVFGFSLWSGCGEESRFAHEVDVSLPKDTDLVGKLEPLAKKIASRLIEARDSNCFNASC